MVPRPIYSALIEANTCLQTGALLACLVMCRRAIEGLAKDKLGTSAGNLHTALQRLVVEGGLHASMFAIADLIRIFGNVGAHSDAYDNPEKRVVENGFKLTCQLIEVVYIWPHQATEVRNILEQTRRVVLPPPPDNWLANPSGIIRNPDVRMAILSTVATA